MALSNNSSPTTLHPSLKCSNCNYELIFGAKHCVECGYFIEPEKIKQWRVTSCDSCNELILKKANFCDLCGYAQKLDIKEKIVEKEVIKEVFSETPKKEEETKECPFCAELIKKDSIVCKHCNRDLELKVKIENKSKSLSTQSNFTSQIPNTNQSNNDVDFGDLGWGSLLNFFKRKKK